MTESFRARRWRILSCIAGIAAALAFLPAPVLAQVATTTVQGTVYRADGSAATGTVLVSWPAFSTASSQAVAAGTKTATIGQDGFLSMNLAPNQGAYPAGTYYTVVYHLDDGTVSKEYWTVPAATTAAISSVRAQLAPATIAVQPVGKSYVDSSIAAITDNYLPLSGGTMSGALILQGDPIGSSQAATKHYADTLASTELPLAGGTLSGALNTPNGVNKLPRVDVRHPDFGVGCPNAADATGQLDSTCALEAAIAWAVANPQGRTYPTVYLAAGTYLISAALYVPCQIHLVGDGPAASILEQSNNTANAITVYAGAAVQPNVWTCNGSLENLTVHALGGHLYTATLIELQNAVGYTILRVRGSNSGGRGLTLVGSTERLKAVDTEWDTIRWPIVATGNELKFLDTQIASPGADANGYCMAPNNCVNGVFPGYTWTGATQTVISASGNGSTATYVISGSPTIAAGGYFTVTGLTGVTTLNGTFQAAAISANTPVPGEYTITSNGSGNGSAGAAGASIGTQQVLVSASANGSAATFVVQGGSDAAGSNGVSPIVAGHWFTIAGIPDLTALNGTWQVASVNNNVPSGGQYTITANIAANGTATVTNATFKPTILPENHSAFFLGGAAISILGGSIKPLWYSGCFQGTALFSGLIEGFYCEGYPINGQPHLNASITEVGLPFSTTLTGPVSNNAAPVASTSWATAYVNNPNDLPSLGTGIQVRILPPDWLPGSTAPSSYVTGIQRGQYEISLAYFSGDGQVHLTTRNYGGTVSQTGIVWPAGSIVAEIPQSSYGTLTVKSSHLSATDPPSPSGPWAAYCNDQNYLICANTIAGPIANGYTTFTNAQPGGAGGAASINFEGDEWWGSGGAANELTGQLFVKVLGNGRITATNSGSTLTSGETSEVTSGQYIANSSPTVVAVQYGDGSTGWVTYSNPQQGTFANSTNGPFYESMVDSPGDPVLGTNPNSGYAMGHQFAGSSCSYDTPPSGQPHATYRFCMKGGPTNSGASSGWEYDIWNGSSWVSAFGISGRSNATANLQVTGATEVQGALTASSINGEVTVDGVTYASLAAAWSAAYAAAVSTGKNQTVRLGPGTFNVTATLSEPTNGACISLLGSGGTTVNAGSAVATTLNVNTNLAGDVFYLNNASQAQGCTFRDFVILAGTNATHGFEMQWFRGLLIDNVTVNDTTAEGILLGEESTTNGHQANFLLRNVTVSYNASLFTPANRPTYGVHIEKTAIDSHLDDIVVRNALTAGVYNEGTGITGYLIHGFGYPYACTTAPCVNNASASTAANASYATNYVIDDVGGGGSVWTDTYADSPAIAGFYVGANGVAIHGGHIQWPNLTSFPAANLAYVAAGVTNNLLIADMDCLGMSSGVNWITYAGSAGNPPSFTSIHHLTGCGNYSQSLEPAEVTGFSSGGANINDPSGAVPRVWSTPIAAASSYPAYSAQLYTGYQGDIFQGHFSGVTPFFNVTYQGTIRSNGGIALGTVLNTASILTLTNANKNVIANAASGAQTITLPSCYTPFADNASPTGLEFTIIKSDTSANTVTLQTVSSQNINYAGSVAQTLVISAAGKRTLVCGPDYNWYAF